MAREKSYIYPTVLVFKTSNRLNAKTKNIDEVLDGLEVGNLPGVPSKITDNEILELSVGSSFIEKFKEKYVL